MAGRQRAPRSEKEDPDRRIVRSQVVRKKRRADYPSRDVAYDKERTGVAVGVCFAIVGNREDVEAK